MHPLLTVVVLPIAMGLLLYTYGKKHFVHVRGPAGEPISRGPTYDLR